MLKQREIQKKYGVTNVPAVTSLSPNKGIMGGPAQPIDIGLNLIPAKIPINLPLQQIAEEEDDEFLDSGASSIQLIVKPRQTRIDPQQMPSGTDSEQEEPDESPAHAKNIQMIDDMFHNPILIKIQPKN